MLKSGIVNPALNALLSRVRHTNLLVIADRSFPSWPSIETVDISLIDDIPKVLDVLLAIQPVWSFGKVWMAREFQEVNTPDKVQSIRKAVGGVPLEWEPHMQFKLRVPTATGLIRTADSTPYSNMIFESA